MKKIYETLDKLPIDVKDAVSKINKETLSSTEEIRLRVNKPLCINAFSKNFFVGKEGELYSYPSKDCLIITKSHIKECFKRCCNYSFHSFAREIKNGYVTINGGHRVGICGEAIYEGKELKTIDNISSLNIRIAREVEDNAKQLFSLMPLPSVGGFIIAGSPKSGKTTLLRSCAKFLSNGEVGDFKKVTIVDERCELAGMYCGEPQNSVGDCCDILSGFKKSDGINIAVRTLSPDYIICDEISLDEEIEAVYRGTNSGANIVTTVHAKNKDEFLKKPFTQKLLETNAFDMVVFLSDEEKGKIEEIIPVSKIKEAFKTQKEKQ